MWTIAGLLAALSMILTIPLTSSTATETITLGPGVLLRAIVAALIGAVVFVAYLVTGDSVPAVLYLPTVLIGIALLAGWT